MKSTHTVQGGGRHIDGGQGGAKASIHLGKPLTKRRCKHILTTEEWKEYRKSMDARVHRWRGKTPSAEKSLMVLIRDGNKGGKNLLLGGESGM